MRFDIITIFPDIFDSYLNESILKRGQQKKLIEINVHNLRDFTLDAHKVVDDRPFGGGIGMVIKIEPVYKAVQLLKNQKPKTKNQKYKLNPFDKLRVNAEPCRSIKNKKSKILLFTPRGKRFNQRMAYQFSKLDQLIMICGRYEGVDERAAKYIADETISIGDYVLMGGELAAMVVVESVARLIPGVLGKPQLLKERISKEKKFIEYPQYTRPEIFTVPADFVGRRRLRRPKAEARRAKAGARKEVCWQVPKVLLSGDHKKIEEWRKKHSKEI